MTDDGPAHSSADNDSGPTTPPGAPGIDYIAVNESPEFTSLKRTHRSFVFPMAAFFIIWYAVYIVLGLGQFVTTFAITSIYVVFANRRLDPQAQAIRGDLEEQEAIARAARTPALSSGPPSPRRPPSTTRSSTSRSSWRS